jgi:hypothetical protein
MDKLDEDLPGRIDMKKSAKRIPICAAKDIGNTYGCDQVLVFAWSRKTGLQHVVTWGRTVEDCDQIAQGGNHLKRVILGWPESESCAEPNRVKKLKAQIAALSEAKKIT